MERIQDTVDTADAAHVPAAPESSSAERLVIASCVAVVVLVLLKMMYMRYQTVDAIIPPRGLLFDAAGYLLLLSPGLFFWRHRPGRIALVMLAALASVLMLGTVVYERYFDEIPSVRVLQLTSQTGELGGSVADLLRLADALFLIDLPIIGWLVASRRTLAPRRAYRVITAVIVASALVAGGLFAYGIREVVLMPGLLNSSAVARMRGVITYQVASAMHTSELDLGEPIDPAISSQVISAIAGLKGPAPDERITTVAEAVASGKNVIVVQAESLQTMLVDAEVGGVAVTPTLNALVRESWYFPHAYAQIGGGNTSDAEFTANTSLYSPNTEPASVAWEDRAIPSLPKVLSAAGYRTMTFHTNYATFWNRRNMYAAIGFDRVYDRSFFGELDVIGFGASDEVLYAKTLDVLLEQRDRGIPFYANIITVTAHHPFKALPASKKPVVFPFPDYPDSTLPLYLSRHEYADRALAGFIAELKRTGLWDECVFVYFGDHAGITSLEPDTDEAAAMEEFLGRPYTVVDRLNVPLVIHLPGQTEGVVATQTAGQIDIMPTVLDVLGLTPADVPMFGRSLFAGGPSFVGQRRWVATGSYLSDSALVMPGDTPGTGKVLPLDPPFVQRRPTAEELAGLETAAQLMLLSDAWADGLPVRPGFVKDESARIPK